MISEKNFTILNPGKPQGALVEMIGFGKHDDLKWIFDSCQHGSTVIITVAGVETKIENSLHIKDIPTAVVWVEHQLRSIKRTHP